MGLRLEFGFPECAIICAAALYTNSASMGIALCAIACLAALCRGVVRLHTQQQEIEDRQKLLSGVNDAGLEVAAAFGNLFKLPDSGKVVH